MRNKRKRGENKQAREFRDVIKLLPPSSIWNYAHYYYIIEFIKLRRQPEKTNEGNLEYKQQLDALEELVNTWAKIKKYFAIILLSLLKIILRFFCLFGLTSKSINKSIKDIENAFDRQATNLKNGASLNTKTDDEISAEKAIARFEEKIEKLTKRYEKNDNISSYIDIFYSSVIKFGTQKAKTEIVYLKAKEEKQRSQALWRDSFIIRAFGFGTFKLAKRLLAILAVGMALPFLINLLVKPTPDYSSAESFVHGIGWTAIFWAITLAITLYFNNKRMIKIWDRAEGAILEAQLLHIESTATLCDETLVDIKNCLNLPLELIEDKMAKTIIEDNFKSIYNMIKGYEERAISLKREIARHNKKVSLLGIIRNLLDQAAQGGAVSEGADIFESMFGG